MSILDSDDLRWTLVTTGSTALAAVVVRKVMETGWKTATGDEPPQNPVAPGVRWTDALAWAGAAGAAAALARVLARRGAAAGWKRLTGRLPPA